MDNSIATFNQHQLDQNLQAEQPPKKLAILSLCMELIELLAIALALVVVIITIFARHSPVIGSSMEPTLHENDVLMISNFFYTPQRGDIVVIQAPNDMLSVLVKRVIATGGDVIEINFVNWSIYVNGELIEEDYIARGPQLAGHSMNSYDLTVVDGVFRDVVPHGHIFVLGDHRNNSNDSRHRDIGFVDNRYVVGRALFRILPFGSFGGFR